VGHEPNSRLEYVATPPGKFKTRRVSHVMRHVSINGKSESGVSRHDDDLMSASFLPPIHSLTFDSYYLLEQF